MEYGPYLPGFPTSLGDCDNLFSDTGDTPDETATGKYKKKTF